MQSKNGHELHQNIFINAKMLVNYRRASSMQWNIENSLVCPVTGTGFSVAASAKNLKLIIWYSGDYFLSIGSVINITQNEVFINGVPGDLQVTHAFPYTENLWSTFSKNIECPGNQNPMLLICNRRSLCKFALCPYGARQKRPQ